ncbi:VOC family protein [Pseudokineococcus sp. 1T1Z-3]|uniref:VOC family protein n=1 Tax=Pseudokineococcus sp. 1T1Z-3 TaxID=3132745 RepID=UPI0030A328AE
MKVMPIRYVRDVAASEHFYAALGLALEQRSRTGGWAEMGGAGGLVALHATDGTSSAQPPTHVELCFVVDGPLEELAARLEQHGIAHDGIVDESFGRFLAVTDPDGLVVQVNEHDPSLYT